MRVVAAVISREDKILVCQRPLHKRHGGLWEFPGGKVERDETDEDSARRELFEELGVRVLGAGKASLEVRDFGSPYVIVFIPVEIDGEPECREHATLQWGTWDAIGTLPLAPADRLFVDRVLAERAANT